MYIQSPQERLSMVADIINDARSIDAMGRTPLSGDSPPVRLSSAAALRIALSKISQSPSPALGSPSSNAVQKRGQVTIYGKTEVDLSASMVPVPIFFTLDPLLATSPPPPSIAVQHRQQTYPPNSIGGAAGPPRSASLGYRRPLTAPGPVPSGLRPGFGGQEMRGPGPPLPRKQVEQDDERSAAVDLVTPRRAASTTAVAITHPRAELSMRTRPAAEMPALSTPPQPPQPPPLTTAGSNAPNSTGSTGNIGSSTRNANDPIPRSNFFSKTSGSTAAIEEFFRIRRC
jgi:hypothetical protein